jgi:hypothetical protein
MSERVIKKQSPESLFEDFKRNCSYRGVYLIFERKYIYPGDPIPLEYGAALVPHYRFLNRVERRQKPKGVKV